MADRNFFWPQGGGGSGGGSDGYVIAPFEYITDGNLGIGGPGDAFYPGGSTNVSIHINWDVVSASAKSFVDGDVSTGSDTITETSHGYLTGLQGQFTTTGVLPTGLSTSTNYYVIKVDADTYKVASTRALADAGTAVNITAASGGGTHTFTPTAGGTIGEFVVQATDFPVADNIWTELALSSIVTVSDADDTAIISLNQVPFRAVRLGYNPTSGQGSYTVYISAKEP